MTETKKQNRKRARELRRSEKKRIEFEVPRAIWDGMEVAERAHVTRAIRGFISDYINNHKHPKD